MKAPSVRPVRCAIYTRVFTEHGLDQEFNSLYAQYDAPSAYIKSLAHAGWPLIRSRYDDGGRAASAAGFCARTRPPGTEFLDAETGPQISPPKWVSAHRDKNPGNEWSEIPAETPYLALCRKSASPISTQAPRVSDERVFSCTPDRFVTAAARDG